MKVFNVLTSPEGRPLQHQTARITLRAPGNPFTHITSEVFQAHAEDTNTSGIWVADLIPNSQYEQAGSYYHVDQRDGLITPDAQHDFRVPDAPPAPGTYPGHPDGQWWIRDLLIIPPVPGTPSPPLPAHYLGDHIDVDTSTEFPGQVLKFNGTKWVPATDLTGGAGGGTGAVYFQPTLTNTVTIAHLLHYRPGGVSLFSQDWQTQYDEFVVTHQDEDNLTVTSSGAQFRGWVVMS